MRNRAYTLWWRRSPGTFPRASSFRAMLVGKEFLYTLLLVRKPPLHLRQDLLFLRLPYEFPLAYFTFSFFVSLSQLPTLLVSALQLEEEGLAKESLLWPVSSEKVLLLYLYRIFLPRTLPLSWRRSRAHPKRSQLSFLIGHQSLIQIGVAWSMRSVGTDSSLLSPAPFQYSWSSWEREGLGQLLPNSFSDSFLSY